MQVEGRRERCAQDIDFSIKGDWQENDRNPRFHGRSADFGEVADGSHKSCMLIQREVRQRSGEGATTLCFEEGCAMPTSGKAWIRGMRTMFRQGHNSCKTTCNWTASSWETSVNSS